jgi:hypothetical protein
VEVEPGLFVVMSREEAAGFHAARVERARAEIFRREEERRAERAADDEERRILFAKARDGPEPG